jgi:hypothetical protein
MAIRVQPGVAPDALDHGIEGRPILPIADVMELDALFGSARLAAIANTDESGMANGRSELATHWFTATARAA